MNYGYKPKAGSSDRLWNISHIYEEMKTHMRRNEDKKRVDIWYRETHET